MISVLILTHNEERNLPGCLASVAWSDDVVVFDSFSSDRTIEIADAAGARVFQHPFENYGMQREAGRSTVSYKHPWLLVLDADERVDPSLADEMQRTVAQDCPFDAFRMRMKNHFMGKWVKYSTLYPGWCVRLLRHQAVHYEVRSVHEYPVITTPIGELRGHLMHYSFNKGLSDWIAKHNRYATLEAEENRRILVRGEIDMIGIISRNPIRRRRALKLLSMRLPCRPMLRFLYMYLFRLGFLDGLPGFNYCRLMYFYELIIVLKLQELLLFPQ